MGKYDTIIVDGRITTVDFIDRGPPLVMTEEQWRWRFWRIFILFCIYTGIIIQIVVFFVCLLGKAMSMSDEAVYFTFILVPIVATSSYVVTYFIFLRFFLRGGPVPGLYLNGIQLDPWHPFVPYNEIKNLRMGRDDIFRIILIELRKEEIGSDAPKRPLELYHYFLGREGIERLEQMFGEIQKR